MVTPMLISEAPGAVEGMLVPERSRQSPRPEMTNRPRENREPFELLDELYKHRAPVKKYPPLQFPTDRLREGIREGTKKKVAQELGLRHFGLPARDAIIIPPHCQQVCLFTDEGENSAGKGQARAGGNFLLGRFEVVALSAVADYDEAWRFVRTGPTTNGAKRSAFWVLHAAALNIGENEHATDFRDYSNEMGRLEFIAYIEDMGRIYENILQAAGALGVTNLVFFPFGMGAFLRNLYKLDPEYAEANLQGQRLRELRQALAKRFVRAVGETKVFVGKIHLCIAPSGRGDELDANSTAFLAEILTGVKTGLIHPKSIETLVNADALVAAQNLADDGYRVGLVNGANRRMVGNHWFSHGARMAIDENLHRRSWRMACTAYVLNGGAEAVSRQPDDLAKAVTRLGGTLIPLANSSAGGDVKGDVIKQFRRWDTSNDGRISKEEMTNVLVALGISAKDCDTIFRAADSNNDGFLSYTEFVYWLYGGQSIPTLTQPSRKS